MKTLAFLSCVLVLSVVVSGRAQFWGTFERPSWRSLSTTRAPKPVTGASADDSATPSVVDGNGSLLGCDCPAPPQFNPVCGSDGVTYGNLQKLNCARSCGRNVRLSFIGACSNG
ncbi:agrin isoform X2 [Cryptotermes secundus]|uniref:agrin isoform X2 n=1 Tax=Cryptotermes secundus TaxID=105785 RepID=UPI000CD7D185|nr:agrin isoform X2 [Cryptotermes secundus]